MCDADVDTNAYGDGDDECADSTAENGHPDDDINDGEAKDAVDDGYVGDGTDVEYEFDDVNKGHVEDDVKGGTDDDGQNMEGGKLLSRSSLSPISLKSSFPLCMCISSIYPQYFLVALLGFIQALPGHRYSTIVSCFYLVMFMNMMRLRVLVKCVIPYYDCCDGCFVHFLYVNGCCYQVRVMDCPGGESL